MVELFELLQQGDLSEDGHGDAVLRQREAHLLQRHDRVRRLVARPVHGAVRACAKRDGLVVFSGDISDLAGQVFLFHTVLRILSFFVIVVWRPPGTHVCLLSVRVRNSLCSNQRSCEVTRNKQRAQTDIHSSTAISSLLRSTPSSSPPSASLFASFIK